MENTNLNVAPYYDDFAEDKNFHRVLFRPGFSVQARELTALQTILQNQVERHGRHMFKEGTVVIPGATGFTNEYYAVKLSGLLETTEVSTYIQDFVGKKITGSASGVVAEVIQAVAATTTDPITLFVKYVATGSDNVTTVFNNGEKISADGTVGAFGSGIDSAQLEATAATATGSSANVQEGVYFVRGHFVKVATQRIILDKYTNTPSYRIGLTVTETLETPEEDTSLLDNAQGSSNVNAKGAHRLKISLALSKLALDSVEDENFIELLRTDSGIVQEKARNTEYSVLGDTLARRTYDLYGDFSVKKFDVEKLETLDDGLNSGVYQSLETTDDGNIASDDFVTMQLSPGKAYVRGYEIETIVPTYVDIAKPRTFSSFNGAVTPVEVGNYALVSNVHGQPEISPEISGKIAKPYRDIQLFDTQNTTGGSSNGTKIGVARVRAIEHHSGQQAGTVDSMSAAAQFKLYMFDLRMFTKLTMSGTPAGAAAGGMVTGAKITGATSGSYGYVHSDSTGTGLVLTTVVGKFQTGEKLISTSSSVAANQFMETSGNTDVTVSAIAEFNFDAVKQVYMDGTESGIDFTADLVLDDSFTVNGTITIGTDKDAVGGFQSDFATDVRVGDIVSLPTGSAGALETKRVDSISGQTLDLSSDVTTSVTSVTMKRLRAKLVDQNKNILLRKLQKDTIKTLKTTSNSFISDSSITIRKSFVGTSNSSGVVTFTTTGANETFNSVDNEDYNLVITTASSDSGTAAVGDVVNLSSDEVTVANNSTSLTITSSSILGNASSVRLVATLTKTVASEKTKVRNRSSLIIADQSAAGLFGTSAHHKEISLAYADIHKLTAVFESPDASTNPRLPQWTITGATGVFEKGEIITGQTSGTKAYVVNPQSPLTFVPINEGVFDAAESILGLESAKTATLETFSAGDRLITNNFVLDSGQRDNFYDIGRLVRKGSAPAPVGKLLVVFDYLTHSTGDFFTVDSYSTIPYKEIPTYSASRVDPETAAPSGEYDLRDTVDFRPRVGDSTVSLTNVALTEPSQTYAADKVTSLSFSFESRDFSGTGGSTTNIPKDGSNFAYDFEFYLPRKDALYLTSAGEFKVSSGTASENPTDPSVINDAMLIAEIGLNAYVLGLEDVQLSVVDNPKYTMADIAKLENRIDNMEYYTVLNLLEKEADSLQIQDANGLDRFKSGFLVDNFSGHATGDVQHPDYRVSIDMQNGELRPKYFMKNVRMNEENTNETDRTSSNYQKTGSLLTLPYEHKVVADQPYATRVENLNPVLNFSWAGNMKLTPEGDEWFETRRLPDLIINREGNFDSVLAANRNAIGTVWNAWQTQWTGVTTTSTSRFLETSWSRAKSTVPFRPIIERTTATTQTGQTRSGISTSVVPRINSESRGDRVVARAVVPFIRARNIHFEASGMKPLTQVYPFFDKRNVAKYVFPTGGGLKGVVSNLVTSLVGSWTSITKIEFDYHKIGSDPLIFTTSVRVADSGVFLTQVNSQQAPGSTRTVITSSGLTLTPDSSGNTIIRGHGTDTNNRIGADDRLYDIRIYDQDGVLIPRTLYQIESASKWTNAGRAIDGSTDSFALFNTSLYSNSSKQNEITIRVMDGSKTILPSSGRLKQYSYLRADETALITDAAGSTEGYFAIPDSKKANNPKFRTGERVFRLTSSSTNVKAPEPETFAQATYTANGEIRSTRETIVNTRNGRVVTSSANQTRVLTGAAATRDAIVGWWDPVAQSFMPQTEGGEYITKIDVFFSQVDENIPVTCQIREMNTGYPTTKVLPFASKTLRPEECAISSDATAATTFTFDEPVYVKNGVEVAIVLQTDSPDYLVWISRMGETDVGGKRLVSEQPYLGVLFKSQNNSTWTAYDMEDLKFKIYRAKFDTTKTATINFVNDAVETVDLENDAIRTFSGVSKVKVLHRDHHMYDATKNNVTISGVTSGITSTLSGAITNSATTLTLATALTGVGTSTAVVLKLFSLNASGDSVTEVVTGTTNSSNSKIVESITRGVEGTAIAHITGISVEKYSIANISLTQINKTHTDINDSQIDSYTVATTTAANASGNFGGSNIIASENSQMDQMQALFSTIENPNTSMTVKMRSTTGTSPSGTESSFVKQTISQADIIPLNDNYVFDKPRLIASQINETNEMSGAKSLEVEFTLQSSKDNLSPIIDLDKRSIVTVSNRLDNIDSSSAVYPTTEYIPPTDPDGDSNESIYITRKAQLANPANSIKCYLDAAKFQSSELQVMFKILRSDDASDFDEIGWQYFNTDGSPDTTVNNSVNTNDFIERVYSVDNVGEFISFAIKIRMQGTNSSEVPRCKDLRAIALAT